MRKQTSRDSSLCLEHSRPIERNTKETRNRMKTYQQWPRSGLSGSLLGCIAAVALSATPLFATIPNDFHQGANNDNSAQPLGYTTWENGGINGQKAILAEGML